MKTVVVLQARCGSTRLPRKVLLPLGGRPLLERLLERVTCARTADAVVVATTTDPADDEVAALSRVAGVACLRGHPTDLLDRHYRVAAETRADVVVKVPSDCPLVDPQVVDRVVTAHLEANGRFDYTSNLHPESYPDGSDVEVMTFDALARAWREADRPYEREHTTPFLWDQPSGFALNNVVWETGRNVSRTHRVVVDYAEDLSVARAVFEALSTRARPIFTVGEIVAFLDAHPEIRLVNERHFGVSWCRHHVGELRTARPAGREERA
jgi:spore coat polysaccharide biosynthesis protein SpsF